MNNDNMFDPLQSQKCIECRKALSEGVVRQNLAVVALLGLCPLLAVSTTLVNGIGLGVVTLLILVLSGTTISAVRHFIPEDIRLPAFVLLIASMVTISEFLLSAYRYEFYRAVGLFIPLIVTNCVILARIESVAYRRSMRVAFMDAVGMGAGFLLVLIVLGAMREMLGYGSLFAGAERLFGDFAAGWKIQLIDSHQGFLLAILPPGAFFGLAMLIALKNQISQCQKSRKTMAQSTMQFKID